jgi:2-(1,2-epoxy-1,2-dihydrophenyl)acetyl-CoA isomerase
MTTRTLRATSYEEAVAAGRSDERALVAVERRDGRALVRLTEPERLNPLSAPLTVQLRDRLSELAADSRVRAIVVTGADPAFSAGGDLRLMRHVAHPMVDDGAAGATDAWRWIRYEFGGIVRLLARTDKPFIAALNGPAAGVGLAFALACDLIIASDRGQLVPAFGRIGLLPEVGTSWLLTRRLGYQRTFELFAGGRHLSASEAYEAGLVNEVVAHADLMARADEWCDRLLALPDHVIPMMKPLLRQAADMTWEQALAMEEFAEPMCFTTRAHREAVAALLDKSGGQTGAQR